MAEMFYDDDADLSVIQGSKQEAMPVALDDVEHERDLVHAQGGETDVIDGAENHPQEQDPDDGSPLNIGSHGEKLARLHMEQENAPAPSADTAAASPEAPLPTTSTSKGSSLGTYRC